MRVLTTIAETRAAARALKASGRKLGLVPTMGALHDGHLSLVRLARKHSDTVAVSIFVNPKQFGPNEDFAKYPRSFDQDRKLLETEGVDLLFAPTVEEIYPQGSTTFVSVEGISERLDGASRPGHFRGVTTVVSKLFHIVEPDRAFFGQKDAAQVAIVKRMVRDLDLPVEIVVGPIVREPDGLAMSSRNAYLDPTQRKQALVLSRALKGVEGLIREGEVDTNRLVNAAMRIFAEERDVRVDYIAVVDPDTLDPVNEVNKRALVAVAAYVGSTRLIDNLVVEARK